MRSSMGLARGGDCGSTKPRSLDELTPASDAYNPLFAVIIASLQIRPKRSFFCACVDRAAFNPTKGYGFIQPQGGGRDVFVHISAVEKAGLNTLNEGQIVQYEVVNNRGKEFGREPQSGLAGSSGTSRLDGSAH